MNKELLTEFQLQAGGSHYPHINTDKQMAFAKKIVEECIAVVKNTGTQCAFTTHDLGMVECTIAKSVDAIKKRFEL
jgi:hypothetical protein